ncbi:MAG: protoporphyrinogen oxidase HemJ [Bacteroidota bacterium]
MYLPLLKALHIMGFVAWFAGLFYLVRLFVYHAEAKDKPALEREILISQFKIMERRVFHLIAHPAMIFTLVCGVGMLIIHPMYMKFGWMHFKLLFVVLLIAYHFYCKKIMTQLKRGTNIHTSFHFRLLNEVPTLLLIAIVLLAVFRTNMNVFYIFSSLLLLGALFYGMVKIYKRRRAQKEVVS